MTFQDFTALSSVIQNLAVVLAAIAAGIWALYRYRIERSLEAAMTMEISASAIQRGAVFMVPVRLSFHNTGKALIASRGRTDGVPVWSDKLETLYFPLNLQVRHLVDPAQEGATVFDWFDGNVATPVEGLPTEINLLRPFELPDSKEPGFLLEPGDKATVEFLLALPPGDYLIKGTFVGGGSDQQFWTDIRYLALPPPCGT